MKSSIKDKVFELGFTAVGMTTADRIDAIPYLNRAIDEGRTADMVWLSRDLERRCDPKSLLPEAKSVICLAFPYDDAGIASSEFPGAKTSRARFARGRDYHGVVKDRMKQLWDFIRADHPQANAKFCVDTGPILEKALAVRAGLGWIGKHTVLVHEKLGSWFVLGEIITDLKLESDKPVRDLCGDCRACIDACPTKALTAPRCLDARRCISYLTIEGHGEITHEFKWNIKKGQYGCDICQEACPFNSKL